MQKEPPPPFDPQSIEEIDSVAAQAEIGSGLSEVAAALFLGGTVCGLVFAVILDLFYLRSLRAVREHHRI